MSQRMGQFFFDAIMGFLYRSNGRHVPSGESGGRACEGGHVTGETEEGKTVFGYLPHVDPDRLFEFYFCSETLNSNYESI